MCDTFFLPPPATNGAECCAVSLPQSGERAAHTTDTQGGGGNIRPTIFGRFPDAVREELRATAAEFGQATIRFPHVRPDDSPNLCNRNAGISAIGPERDGCLVITSRRRLEYAPSKSAHSAHCAARTSTGNSPSSADI
ncbi:hypothetical protein GCM10010306_072200 [Streptomyces umbrinus]|nr:hypothetical protein GCM10010306_072200 [Streptomyces umbrinus]